MVGIATCTMALVVVLSAFNGIEELVSSLYNSFNSDLKISLAEGKTFEKKEISLEKLKAIKGVKHCSRIIEESVVIKYDSRQTIAIIKGIEDEFLDMSGLDTMIKHGELVLNRNGYNQAILGWIVKNKLDIPIMPGRDNNLLVFAPLRGKNIGRNLKKAFNSRVIQAAGAFTVNAEIDQKYIVVPINFASEVLAYNNEISAVEVGLEPDADDEDVRDEVKALLGDKFLVKTRYQQNEVIYETTKAEKWVTFIILSFILLIATFNVIASLTMLVIEKKQDMAILTSLGASEQLIRKIFFFEGLLINVLGGGLGLLMGFLLCQIQKDFGLLRLSGSIVEFYPIKMFPSDFFAIMAMVFGIGILASWLPVFYLTKYHLKVKAL